MGLIIRNGIPYGSVSEPQREIEIEDNEIAIGENQWLKGSGWTAIDDIMGTSDENQGIVKTLNVSLPNTFVDGTEITPNDINLNGVGIKAKSTLIDGTQVQAYFTLQGNGQIHSSDNALFSMSNNTRLFFTGTSFLNMIEASQIDMYNQSSIQMSGQVNLRMLDSSFIHTNGSSKIEIQDTSTIHMVAQSSISMSGATQSINMTGDQNLIRFYGTKCTLEMTNNLGNEHTTELKILDGSQIHITGRAGVAPDLNQATSSSSINQVPQIYVHGTCRINIDDGGYIDRDTLDGPLSLHFHYKSGGPRIYIHDCPVVNLDHEATIIGHDMAKICFDKQAKFNMTDMANLYFAGGSDVNISGSAQLCMSDQAQLVMSTLMNNDLGEEGNSPVFTMGGAAMIQASSQDLTGLGPYFSIAPNQLLFQSQGFSGKLKTGSSNESIPIPEPIEVGTPTGSKYCNPQGLKEKIAYGEKFIDENNNVIYSDYISSETYEAAKPLIPIWVAQSDYLDGRYTFPIDTYYVFTKEFYDSFVKKYKEKNNNKNPYGKTDFYLKVYPTTEEGANIINNVDTIDTSVINGFVFSGMDPSWLQQKFTLNGVSYESNTRTIYAIRVKSQDQIKHDLNLIKETMDLTELTYTEMQCFAQRQKTTNSKWELATFPTNSSLNDYVEVFLGDWLFQPKTNKIVDGDIPELTECFYTTYNNIENYYVKIDNYLNLYTAYTTKGARIKTGVPIGDDLAQQNTVIIAENNCTTLIGGEQGSFTWIKVGGRKGDNTQVHLLDNSHTEVRQDSILSLRGKCQGTEYLISTDEDGHKNYETYYRPWADYPYEPITDGSTLTLYDHSIFSMRGIWDTSPITLSNGEIVNPPEGWSEHPIKKDNSPLVEIIDNSEVRLYGNISIKANTENDITSITFGGTMNEGEVSFTIAELQALKNLLNS